MANKLKTDPLISVIMATYNGEEHISEAIQSILNQSFTDFEFIIVDDGSTDGVADKIKSFRDTRIKFIKKEVNTGIAESLNLGIASAKGQYIARMDDDDVASPERFEEQLKAFKEDQELILCASNVIIDQQEKIKTKGLTHEEIKVRLVFGNTITHPTVMIKREILQINPYNPRMVPSEDYDLWSRLINRGKFRVLDTPLLYYRYRLQSETSRRRKEQLQLNTLIIQYLFDKLNWEEITDQEKHIKTMAEYDYSLDGPKLRKFMGWFETLREHNKKHKVFDQEIFNRECKKQQNKYLRHYFSNKKWKNKIIPFLYLKLPYKMQIFNYYFKKALN